MSEEKCTGQFSDARDCPVHRPEPQPQPDIDKLLYYLAMSGYAAYSNSLSGAQTPAMRAFFERATHPQVGDLVLEITSAWAWRRNSSSPGASLGVLLRRTSEPVITAEALAELHAVGEYYRHAGETIDDIPKEDVIYIRPLDGSFEECRWSNCQFIALRDREEGGWKIL